MPSHNLVFNGLSPHLAKRRALNFWYTHRESLGLTVSEFFQHCRISHEGAVTRIVFHADPK
ncbi:hypothetical protein KKF91_11975 [Myxococcota bacterium]|nr:hypothetical protein [Myxococcota bacterium]MBU1431248.1 hypothetical protein [Myxococcota bacterium]MBU1898063.1 hypothetical protein [Myxococcota bacterium]